VPVAHRLALGGEGVREELLGAALLEDPRARERGRAPLGRGEVGADGGAVRTDPDPSGELGTARDPVRDAQLVEDLHAAGLHHDRPRLARGPRLAVDDERGQPAAAGDERGHETRRPRADDQQIGVQRCGGHGASSRCGRGTAPR
jgi:hypothetical protein